MSYKSIFDLMEYAGRSSLQALHTVPYLEFWSRAEAEILKYWAHVCCLGCETFA